MIVRPLERPFFDLGLALGPIREMRRSGRSSARPKDSSPNQKKALLKRAGTMVVRPLERPFFDLRPFS